MGLWLIGEHRGQIIRQVLNDGEFQVGRGSANDLVLPSQTVSRHHATLHVAGTGMRVADLGSLNGTRVNGKPVEGEATARPGDLVEFGSVLLRLSDRDESIAPLWSAEDSVSSKSVYLSRDEITDSHRKVAGGDPNVMRALIEAGQLLVLPEAPDQTFDRVLELVESVVPAGRILLLLQEEKGKDPVQRAARVQGDRAISPLRVTQTMVHMVLNEGAAVLTGDAQADERFRQAQSIVAQDVHSAMAAPLVHHEVVLGLLYVDTNNPFATYTEHDLRVLTLLGQMLGAKIANARLLEVEKEQQRLKSQLDMAREIQRRLLPQDLPSVAGYEICARQHMCEAVGGDLYDAAPLQDGRTLLCLGDVSGKGIGAALLMTEVIGTLRAFRTVLTDPLQIVSGLDRNLLQSTLEEHYLTLFLACLDTRTSRLQYVNAGHPAPFFLHPDGRAESLESTGPPVGLVDFPELAFECRPVDLPPGVTLIVYSDGVSEAENAKGDQFGEGRFSEILPGLAGRPADEIVQRIEHEVEGWTGHSRLADDLTLLVIRRLPS